MQSTRAQLEQGKANDAGLPAPKGDGSRIERTVWIVLLMLPLVAYCVVTVLTYSIKPTPINTGDPLYDKYLAWVADDLVDNYDARENSLFTSEMEYIENKRDLDPFAGWEGEFGDDSRYWMLRYKYSRIKKGGWAIGWDPDIRHLEKARELEVSDEAILMALVDAKYSGAGSYAESSSNIWEKLDPLLEELLEFAKDESFPHYYSALRDTEQNNYQAAILHLADGNQAPCNSSLIGFPFENVISAIQSGKPLPDELVSVLILFEEESILPNVVPFFNMVDILVAVALVNDDRVALDEIHTFICRFGGAEERGFLGSYFSAVMVRDMVRETNRHFGNSVSTKKLANLGQLSSFSGQVTSYGRMGGGITFIHNPWGMSQTPQQLWHLEGYLSGGRSTRTSYLKAYNDGHNKELKSIAGPIKQLFEKMESFNYNTLEFE